MLGARPQRAVSGGSDSRARSPRGQYLVWPYITFVSVYTYSRRAVVSYWPKYVNLVLVNHLEGLSLPRNSVVRSTDHPDMTIAVDHGRKAPAQQQQQLMLG